MSLLFNTLPRLDSFSSKKQASFSFVTAVTICSDFGAQVNKICQCFHFFPLLFAMKWIFAIILVFWMLSLKPPFSLFSFIFIKRLLSSSSLATIKVVSFAYLRLLLYLPAILIPACDSSSLAFLMMFPACKLNNQSDSIQSWHTLFPILNQSIVSCPVLTVVSWPAYKILRRQVGWSYIPFTSWQIDGGKWKQCQTLFSWAPKSLQILTAAMKLTDTHSLEGKIWPT